MPKWAIKVEEINEDGTLSPSAFNAEDNRTSIICDGYVIIGLTPAPNDGSTRMTLAIYNTNINTIASAIGQDPDLKRAASLAVSREGISEKKTRERGIR